MFEVCMLRLTRMREQIPITRKRIYLDNAGAGPPTLPVINAMSEFLEEWNEHGSYWHKWLQEIIDARKLFAKLIGASFDEVALVSNVTSGIISIATSLEYKRSGNAVLSDQNFPTNIYIWHARRNAGFLKDVRVLRNRDGRIPIQEYEKAIDDRTVIVPLDYVSYQTGYRESLQEIAEIAHSRGAIVLVDAFQALGVLPMDVEELQIDVLVSGMYKWLLGPHSPAFMYVRKELVPKLHPTVTGWWGVKDTVITRMIERRDLFGKQYNVDDAVVSDTATRFEWGTPSVVAVAGAKAALSFAIKNNLPSQFRRVQSLTQRLADGLSRIGKGIVTPLEPEHRSGIMCFKDPHPSRTVAKLDRAGISVSGRYGAVRVSPHYYNTNEEIEKFLEVMEELS
jgi:selenocysteine lyase/cysteine desulfurase